MKFKICFYRCEQNKAENSKKYHFSGFVQIHGPEKKSSNLFKMHNILKKIESQQMD